MVVFPSIYVILESILSVLVFPSFSRILHFIQIIEGGEFFLLGPLHHLLIDALPVILEELRTLFLNSQGIHIIPIVVFTVESDVRILGFFFLDPYLS